MNLEQVNSSFSIPDCLCFEQNDEGLIFANVTTQSCTGQFYLQGAHITQWQPTGHEPVLFLSDRSAFKPGKAIRGGVPIIFPWFGARTKNACSDRTDGPAHGFARTAEWEVESAKLVQDDLVVQFILLSDDNSRALGFDQFEVRYRVTFAEALTMELDVQNHSSQPLCFEEALHTYLQVSDVAQIEVTGLGGATYLDKTDGFKTKSESDKIFLRGETDRLYIHTDGIAIVSDGLWQRQIAVDKSNSKSTVVWNPWSDATAKMADMSPQGWQSMVCVETANANVNAITLNTGQSHSMQAKLSVSKSG